MAEPASCFARGASGFDIVHGHAKTAKLRIPRFVPALHTYALKGFGALDGSIRAKQRPDPDDPESVRRGHVSCRFWARHVGEGFAPERSHVKAPCRMNC